MDGHGAPSRNGSDVLECAPERDCRRRVDGELPKSATTLAARKRSTRLGRWLNRLRGHNPLDQTAHEATKSSRPMPQWPNLSLATLGGRGPSSSRSGVPPHHHEALSELRTGDIVSTNESEKASTAAPESLVSVLAAANGFTRCACMHVLGLAHVNARELLIKYLVHARRKGIK